MALRPHIWAFIYSKPGAELGRFMKGLTRSRARFLRRSLKGEGYIVSPIVKVNRRFFK